MKVEVKDLREGPVELEVSESPKHLELVEEQYEFPERVTGKMRFQLIEDKVFVTGDLDTRVDSKCVRCLEPVSLPLHAHMDVMYENNPELNKPEHKFLGAEDDFLSYWDGDSVSPETEMREALLLELPSLPVCSEECKGLCPNCGTNLNNETCSCTVAQKDEANWKASLKNIKLD